MFSEGLAKAAGKGGQTRADAAPTDGEAKDGETSSKYVSHFNTDDVGAEEDEAPKAVDPGELI